MRAPARLTIVALVLTACSAPASTPSASAELPPSASARATPPAPSPARSPSVAPSTTPAAAAWTQLSARADPGAREDHTWTASGTSETAYLFGGRAGGAALDDLWSYELAADAWTPLEPAGSRPPARFGHEAVWVDGIGLVIFAGQAGTTFFNDLWAYDPATNAWRSLPASGAIPAARYGTCAAIGRDGRLWISHGFTSDGTRFSDTLAYDFASGAWSDETPLADRPVNRCLHGCWWTDGGAFVLYAGQTTDVTALGDLWSLQLGERPGASAWVRADGPLPPDRNLYARTRVEGATLVFGGQALDAGFLADLWRFGDDGTVSPVEVGESAPPGRAGAELVWDEARGRALLFGGKDASGELGDLWAFSLGG